MLYAELTVTVGRQEHGEIYFPGGRCTCSREINQLNLRNPFPQRYVLVDGVFQFLACATNRKEVIGF